MGLALKIILSTEVHYLGRFPNQHWGNRAVNGLVLVKSTTFRLSFVGTREEMHKDKHLTKKSPNQTG